MHTQGSLQGIEAGELADRVPRGSWNDHLKRGFKASAKRLALKVRADHDLASTDVFDPAEIARLRDIGYLPLSKLGDVGDQCIHQLTVHDPGAFSAVVVRHGDKQLIVVNDAHSPQRQASSGAHELSHVLLEHEHSPLFDKNFCREHDAVVEAEATYLASVLLVPESAVMHFVRTGVPIADAASCMGVSTGMMQWRVNNEGAIARVGRERSRRNGGRDQPTSG